MWKLLDINSDRPKFELVKDIESNIIQLGYAVVDRDVERPWGGYFRFEEKHSQDFKKVFFKEVQLPNWAQNLPFSPKILFTAPHKRLSWQYHHRRGEVWKMLQGDSSIYTSDNDQQPEQPTIVQEGQVFEVPVTHRHRLCGRDSWVIWAEMWIHTSPDNPSVEDDNVRVSDDFGR